jgi:ribosomal subunit interface protein
MKAGIWLDMRRAFIVLLEEAEEKVFEVESQVEDYHIHGGYGGARKDMPQDARSDKKLQARRELQLRRFNMDIIDKLPRLERLLVFGPGEAKTQFVATLKEHVDFRETPVVTETADMMTQNQIRARVQDFFAVRDPMPLTDMPEVPVGNVDVTHEFVNMAVSPTTEALVNQKLEKFMKRYPWIVRAKAFYKLDKDPGDKNFVCEIELSVPGKNIFSKARAEDLPKAIAETMEELRRQLRKRKTLQNS